MTVYQEWMQALLFRRKLNDPDGRPLFAYRLSDEEFDGLKKLLSRCDHRNIEMMGYVDHYLTCWFLYAAEWWKRSYSGGAWSWTPMFQTLNHEDLSQQERRKWVDLASEFWRLKDEIVGGKRFLGKVVVNGGLPLKLIKEADGRLYGILHATLNEALRSSTPLNNAQLLTQIELQSSYLPKSYRQPTVYGLLAQVISTVLALKSTLTSTSEVDPVTRLDRQKPDWLNEFPLQIDSDSARQLLVKLIRQAVSNPKQVKQQFSIARYLRFNTDRTEWQYECSLEASSRYTSQALAEMLGIEEINLPITIDLVLTGDKSSITVGQLYRRENDYVIKLNHPSLPDNLFQQNLKLDVSRFGQHLGAIDLESAEAPDPGVPWIFEEKAPTSRLLWAGSRKISNATCYALVPEETKLESGQSNAIFISTFHHRSLIRINTGTSQVQCDGEHYEITCGSSSQQFQDGVIWNGRRIFIQSNPPFIFVGKPTVELVDGEGIRRLVPNSELFWRTRSHESPLAAIKSFGVGTIYWKQNGKVILRQRAVCLPTTRMVENITNTPPLEFKYIEGNKPRGQITFNGWPFVAVTCASQNVQISGKCSGTNWDVEVISMVTPPPLTVDLQLHWSDGNVQSVCLPFPVEGAFIVDDGDQPVNHSGIVSLNALNHLHVHLRGKNIRNWQIRLLLISSSKFRQAPMQIIKLRKTDENSNVIRLFDLREQVKRLLSLSDELDVRVKIDFEYGENSKATLQVARYAYRLNQDSGKGWVEIDNATTELAETDSLNEINLRTVPLLACDQAPRSLEAIYSEGTHTGNWDFSPEIKQPGLWLIYPSADSSIKPRPLIWFVPERYAKPPAVLSNLRQAMSIANREERLSEIELVFESISSDPFNEDWDFVQSIIDKFSHLPLPSLDIWVALVRVPKAVVCAYLKLENFTGSIAPRISEELPFDWLLTSPQDWLEVIHMLSKNARENDNERELRFLRSELEYRLEWIFERHSGLDLSVKLGKMKGLGLSDDLEANALLKSPSFIANFLLQNLLFSDESDMSKFIRRASQNATVDLPAPFQLRTRTLQFANSSIGREMLKKLTIEATDWKHSLIVAPFMIAFDVAQGNESAWNKQIDMLNAIRQYRDFDRIWFDDAYKVAMACAFNKGLITV